MAKKYLNPHIKRHKAPKLSIDELYTGIKNRDIRVLSQAITLIESDKDEDQRKASDLLFKLGPSSINSRRIGITGSPGVGKSSFIEAYAMQFPNKSFAILAIDPSSGSTGGSILGDKTRMKDLTSRKNVFIRPSPAGKTLGGIAAKTKEVMLLCEHAGFDEILIETVGVGQSETKVSQMVDLMMLLILPGSGDEIQGIKRGIVELADLVVITKDEPKNETNVKFSTKAYRNALHLLKPKYDGWTIPVVSTSIFNNESFATPAQQVDSFYDFLQQNDFKKRLRHSQDLRWYDQRINDSILQKFTQIEAFNEIIERTRKEIKEQNISVISAIRKTQDWITDRIQL